MFNTKTYENSRADGFPVLEIVREETGLDFWRAFVPLKHTRLRGDVTGPLAALTLAQTFGYGREQSDKILEAVYRFPLPGDAAVTGVRVQFGDVQIIAELKARQQAETDYTEAVQQGRQAALATRESPDVFTLRVAGLQPDQEVRVETSYVQLAKAEGSRWMLRIPLTTSPRYVRADEAGSRHAEGQPLALLRDPGHRFALDVKFEQAGEVKSSTHALDVQDVGGNGKQVRLRDGDVLPDRDCVLSWQAHQEAALPGLSVFLHDDKVSGYAYFLALLAPLKASPTNTDVPREIVLLVDHSGSMTGAKWEASDWAVKQFLGNLTDKDTFALGLFHDTTMWYKHGGLHREGPHAANSANVERALQFLEGNRDSGGTELGVALEQALRLHHANGDLARHVLIVTDAEVSDGGRLLRLAEAEAATPDRRRISVLCIDAAPNAFLAAELAERGGGISKFLTSSPEEEDITTALDAVLEDFAQPVLANLKLEVNCAGVEASGRNVLPGRTPQTSAIDMGDLPRGRAVWVVGRVKRGDEAHLDFAITVNGREVARTDVDAQTQTQRPAIKALFGAKRVLALEYLSAAHYDTDAVREQLTRLGYDAKTVLSGAQQGAVYAENADVAPHDALKKLLVKEALEYGLASSETAFVAVRTEAGKPIEDTVNVANALPSGWLEQSAMAAAPMSRARYRSASFGGATAPSPAPGGASRPSRLLKRAGGAMPSSAVPPPPLSGATPFDFASSSSTPGLDVDYNTPVGEVADGAATMDWMEQEQERGLSPLEEESLAVYLMDSPAPLAPPTPVSNTAQSGQSLFAGVPAFVDGEAVLFDTGRKEDSQKLPASATFTRIEIRFPNGKPDVNALMPGLTLLLFVDDLAQPRARVRLADLLRQGGARPLNVQRQFGQIVRIALVDDSGNPFTLPTMEVALRW